MNRQPQESNALCVLGDFDSHHILSNDDVTICVTIDDDKSSQMFQIQYRRLSTFRRILLPQSSGMKTEVGNHRLDHMLSQSTKTLSYILVYAYLLVSSESTDRTSKCFNNS
jgi:hypothetical protein